MNFATRRIISTLLAGMILLPIRSDALIYYFAVDVPTKLGATEFATSDIIQSASAIYGLMMPLAPGLQLGALHQQPDGIWLFSPAHPVTLDGTEYEPRDVVGFNGTSYFPFLHGNDFGIPPEARIDALMFNQSGRTIVSFDIPVEFGNSYGPSDLVSLSTSGPALYWSADATGVPEDANLIGASLDGNGALILSFDVPVLLGGTEFQPGQLIQYNGGLSFSSYFKDNSWPAEAHLADFALPSPSGAVPNTLFVTKGSGGVINLTWTGSCQSSDFDYEIYEGSMAGYYSHTNKYCTTAHASTKSFVPPPGSVYYLIVPRNSAVEGSYGTNSGGSQRPQGAAYCAPQLMSSCSN